MADQVDRANEIEGQSTEREIERIRSESGELDESPGEAAAGAARQGEPRTEAEIEQWVKDQTSMRPKKPLPSE